MRCSTALAVVCGFSVSVSPAAFAQYSDKLDDINTSGLRAFVNATGAYFRPPTPIGNLGHIDTVVDLRGFMPMLFGSKSEAQHLQWFKVPTGKALMLLYYGTLPFSRIADAVPANDSAKTSFLPESNAGAFEPWVELAYKIAHDAAPPVFEKIAGSGFQNAEPTTLLFTKESAFFIINFKYSSLVLLTFTNAKEGQVLTAMEFSRASKRYKTFYNLHSTLTLGLGKSGEEAMQATAPYVLPAIRAVFGQ